MHRKARDFLARFRSPDFQHTVLPHGSDPLALRRPAHTTSPAAMTVPAAETVSTFQVPNKNRAILSDRGTPPAIMRQRNIPESLPVPSLADPNPIPCQQVPEL